MWADEVNAVEKGSLPSRINPRRLRLIQPRRLIPLIKPHNQRTDPKRPNPPTLRIPLLHPRHMFRNILNRDRILHRQSMALRLQPRIINQNPRIGVETRESQADVRVDQANLGGGDARVLQFHGGPLFAAENDDGGAFDADGAGAALDGFEGVFDLEDMAVGAGTKG